MHGRCPGLLDALREKGNLADGVPIDADGGGILKVVFCRTETLSQLPPELKGGNGDNNILAVALEQRLQEVMGSQPPVVLVTKDTNLRIKADAVGLTAQDYTTDKVDLAGLYSGCCELWVSTTQMEQTRGEAGLPVAALDLENGDPGSCQREQLLPNEGVTLLDLDPAPAHPAGPLRRRHRQSPGPPEDHAGATGAHSTPQQGADLCPGSSARPRGATAHDGGQGRHRQDPAGSCGGSAPGGG